MWPGMKSTSLRIEGKNAYGLLQGERGVHRLVRISPLTTRRAKRHSQAWTWCPKSPK